MNRVFRRGQKFSSNFHHNSPIPTRKQESHSHMQARSHTHTHKEILHLLLLPTASKKTGQTHISTRLPAYWLACRPRKSCLSPCWSSWASWLCRRLLVWNFSSVVRGSTSSTSGRRSSHKKSHTVNWTFLKKLYSLPLEFHAKYTPWTTRYDRHNRARKKLSGQRERSRLERGTRGERTQGLASSFCIITISLDSGEGSQTWWKLKSN